MRALAVTAALAGVLFLATGGRLIVIPLLLVPLGLVGLLRRRSG